MIQEVIVVEGKSDIARLRQSVDADVIATEGFCLRKDVLKEIALAYKQRGIIILTDPDSAGERIRAFLAKRFPNARHDGRDLGGRLSALLGLGLVADCIDCSYADDSDSITWIRPAYTGKLLVKILTTTRPQLATISDRIFRGNAFDGARQGEIIKEPVDLSGLQPLQQVKSFEAVAPGQVDVSLDDAEIIVSAGRGVGDEEGLKKVEAFAAAIGAACGVSKPLVDNGWAPHGLRRQ